MPEEGICKKSHNDMLTEEEMVQAVRAAASLGITKPRITGGEPLLKKNTFAICKNCAAVPGIREVCITTNGILLPKYAADLKTAGVKHVNLSLDTLNTEKTPVSHGGAGFLTRWPDFTRRWTPALRKSKSTPCSSAASMTTKSQRWLN